MSKSEIKIFENFWETKGNIHNVKGHGLAFLCKENY